MSRILVLTAHLLDEIFAEFGALSEHVKSGDAVSIVMFSDYLTAAGMLTSGGAIVQNQQRVRIGCKNMTGTDDIWMHRYMPGNFPEEQIAQHIAVHINRFKPNLIRTHSISSDNADHKTLRQAADSAAARAGVRILSFNGVCAKDCA